MIRYIIWSIRLCVFHEELKFLNAKVSLGLFLLKDCQDVRVKSRGGRHFLSSTQGNHLSFRFDNKSLISYFFFFFFKAEKDSVWGVLENRLVLKTRLFLKNRATLDDKSFCLFGRICLDFECLVCRLIQYTCYWVCYIVLVLFVFLLLKSLTYKLQHYKRYTITIRSFSKTISFENIIVFGQKLHEHKAVECHSCMI